MAELGAEGVQQLGGKDLDAELLKIIRSKFKAKTGGEFDAIDCNATAGRGSGSPLVMILGGGKYPPLAHNLCVKVSWFPERQKSADAG